MVSTSSEKSKQSAGDNQAADRSIDVYFSKSGIKAKWSPEKGTLLELAEAEGLAPENFCREGECGVCVTKIKAGSVYYILEPFACHRDDEVLICCSTPRLAQEGQTSGETAEVNLGL